MKNKIILLLTMLALASRAQVAVIDGLALHTNIAVTTGAQLTVIGLFTNDTYSASNQNYVTQGDAWQPTGISKINSNFSWVTNQLILLMSLPNQINTNMAANIAVISNGFILASNAFANYLVTNQFAKYMATNLLPNYVATNPVGGPMNFDHAAITSDGSGNITALSIAAHLLDSTASSGLVSEVPVANGDGTWDWGAGGSSYPDITDNNTGPWVGIANASPAYTLDVGGNMNLTDLGSGNTLTCFAFTNQPDPTYTIGPSALFQSSTPLQFYGTSISEANNPSPVEFIANGTDNGGNSVRFLATGLVRFENDSSSAVTILSVDANGIQFDAPGTAGGAFTEMPFQGSFNDGWIGLQNTDPQYVLDVYGQVGDSIDGTWNIAQSGLFTMSQLASDAGNFTSDGSGNVTALTFIPLSDRALKENITLLPSARALMMVMTLTNYTWNFKARTNMVPVITESKHSPTTNSAGKITRYGYIFSTNLVPKIIPASGRQFGPMAQDWHAATSLDDGRHISMTAMQGLLLGAVQGLAANEQALASRCPTNTAGAATALPLADPSGVVWYVHVDTNGILSTSQAP